MPAFKVTPQRLRRIISPGRLLVFVLPADYREGNHQAPAPRSLAPHDSADGLYSSEL